MLQFRYVLISTALATGLVSPWVAAQGLESTTQRAQQAMIVCSDHDQASSEHKAEGKKKHCKHKNKHASKHKRHDKRLKKTEAEKEKQRAAEELLKTQVESAE